MIPDYIPGSEVPVRHGDVNIMGDYFGFGGERDVLDSVSESQTRKKKKVSGEVDSDGGKQ